MMLLLINSHHFGFNHVKSCQVRFGVSNSTLVINTLSLSYLLSMQLRVCSINLFVLGKN